MCLRNFHAEHTFTTLEKIFREIDSYQSIPRKFLEDSLKNYIFSNQNPL